MGFTQSFLGLTPQIWCWVSLLATVVGLGVGFYFTNITAFARRIAGGQKKPTGGVVGREARTSDDKPVARNKPAQR
jgi:hypothetical protein